MKKNTLLLFMLILPLFGYSQLAEEGFEGTWGTSGPVGWGIYHNTVGSVNWRQTVLGNIFEPPYEDDYAAFLAPENVPGGEPAKDWLVTPQFNLPAHPKLTFYTRQVQNGTQGSTYRLLITTGDPSLYSSYTVVEEWTELELNPAQTDYIQVDVTDFPATFLNQNVYIAFYMEGDNADGWFIDNVSVVEQCLTPEDLDAQNITTGSADLSWTDIAGADEWEIEFLEATEAATGTGVSYSGTMPYFKDGLDPNTDYRFLVRAVCDDGSSAWAGPFVFTTLSLGDTCEEPYQFTTLPYYITGNTADNANNYEGSAGEESGCGVIAWQEYLNGNDVIFEYTPAFTGEIIINLTNASNASGVFVYDSCDAIGVECIGGAVTGWEGTSASIPSLSVSAGETYYILISSLNGTTPYTLAIQQVGCEQPEGLPTTGADLDSALLSWTNPTDADSWEIVIQAPGLGLPAGTGDTIDTNTNYLADGLDPATPYEYYVRADCGDGTFSAWSGPYLFNTSICDLAQQCNYAFVLTDTGANGWNENTMTVSQNGVTVVVLGPDFTSGAGPVTITVPLCDGMPLQLYWNSGGFEEQQVGVAIKNPFGQTIYAKAPGQGVQNSLLFDGDADCNTILCLPPSDLTATDATLETIDLGWDGPSTGSWEYVIVPAGDPAPGDADSGTETLTNPVTVDDLDPATNYEYYVRMLCDGADPNSDWAGPYPFSTAICPPANQCNYSFVMTSPDGIGYQGHNLTISQNGINVATIGGDFTEGESMTVTVPLCEGQPFQVYWNLGGGGIQIGLSIINAFGQTLYSITPGDETPGSLIYTGDIVDCDNPACMPPNNLTASNPTMNTIDLSWEGLPTGAWDYFVTEAGNPAPTADTPGEFTDTNPVTVPDLLPSTNYEYYVRVVCSGGPETSEWAGPFPFNTIVCDPAGQCVYTFEMTSALGWGWEGHTMSVFQGGVPIATIGDDFQGGSSQNVDIPLCPGVEVEVFWNDGGWGNPNDKGLVIYTPYMEDFFEMLPGEGTQNTIIFTGTPNCDAPLCPKPQDLNTGDITETTAVLNWTEMGTATDWEIWVLPTSAPVPTTPGTEVEDTASYLAEELSSGAAYVFYVRANCGSGNFSTWSGPFLFATPLQNDDCDTATVLIPAEGVECTNPVSGILNGSTSSGITSNCTWGTPNNDVWYQFVATATTHNVSITNQTGEYLPFHAIYENTCGELNEIYCGYDAGGSTISELTIGNTYWVQVYMDPGTPELTSITSFDICILTPTGVSIIIDQDEYTVEEIVNDVLISSNCGGVSNITWSTGTTHGAVSNGIAYFNRGLTDFPLDEGILLTTGFAKQAMGPNTSTMGNDPLGGGDWWPGDDQLFEYVQESGINPFLMSLNQASILEFDFVPVTDHIKFPFIFASEEYDGSSQCFYSDAFAFFLTDQDGNVINLGVIPESTVPVTSKTIRDEQYNDPSYEFPCESVNPDLFDKYYGPFNGLNPLTAPTNYNGHTKVLYAEADVIPGQTYHIKMVVADDLSTAMDTGVFIGPFDIGNVDIGVDLTVEDGNALCYGEEYTIESGLDPELYQITWSLDGEIIEGEMGPNLTVTEAGEYTINVQYLTTTCGGSDTVVIEYHPAVEEVVGDPIDLMLCDPDGIATFNLSQNIAIMLAGLPVSDYTITFHINEADAISGNAPLEMLYENVIPFLQTIYVRIVNEVTECTAVKQFTLVVVDTPPQFELTPDLVLCDAVSGTLAVTPLDFDADEATYAWMYNGNPVGDNSPVLQGIGFGEYTVTVTLGTCSETKTTSITEDSGAVAMQIHHGCEGTVYMISVSAVDGSFDLESSEISWSGPNGFSSAQAASEIQSEGTYTVTVTTAEGCIGQQSVNVESTSCLIPRGISPNGDGKNDAFDLEGFNVRRLSIFNRYGREVYNFEGIYTNQWHGQTDNGEELPTGTYFYSLERDNGETKTGWVYINTQEN